MRVAGASFMVVLAPCFGVAPALASGPVAGLDVRLLDARTNGSVIRGGVAEHADGGGEAEAAKARPGSAAGTGTEPPEGATLAAAVHAVRLVEGDPADLAAAARWLEAHEDVLAVRRLESRRLLALVCLPETWETTPVLVRALEQRGWRFRPAGPEELAVARRELWDGPLFGKPVGDLTCARPQDGEAAAETRPLVSLETSLGTLRDAFRRASDEVRILAVLSPT